MISKQMMDGKFFLLVKRFVQVYPCMLIVQYTAFCSLARLMWNSTLVITAWPPFIEIIIRHETTPTVDLKQDIVLTGVNPSKIVIERASEKSVNPDADNDIDVANADSASQETIPTADLKQDFVLNGVNPSKIVIERASEKSVNTDADTDVANADSASQKSNGVLVILMHSCAIYERLLHYTESFVEVGNDLKKT